MPESMFNQEQLDYMKHLSRTPNSELCVCGWYMRKECEGGYMEEHCSHYAKVAERQAHERQDDIH